MRAGGDRSVQKGYRTAEGLVVSNRVGGSSAAGAVVRARSVLCRVRSCCKPDTRKGHVSVRACGVAGIVLQGELSDVLRKKIQTSAHAILRALSCSVHKACDPFVADGMAGCGQRELSLLELDTRQGPRRPVHFSPLDFGCACVEASACP